MDMTSEVVEQLLDAGPIRNALSFAFFILSDPVLRTFCTTVV